MLLLVLCLKYLLEGFCSQSQVKRSDSCICLISDSCIHYLIYNNYKFTYKNDEFHSLISIQALLSAPNPDDPLSDNIAKHWKSNEAEAVETGQSTQAHIKNLL